MTVSERRWQDAWRARSLYFPPRIEFDRPSATLAVSVTGRRCALRCAHCNGHYLAGMRSLDDPALEQASSLLISGGCDAEGRVPLLEHLGRIAQVGAGKRLNWHVGLIDEQTMRALQPHVDVVSFDLVGDDATIGQVYGLARTVEDYARTYGMLRRYSRVVPHLTIGLHAGQLRGERRVLELLREQGAEALVFLVFIPTAGTAYEHCAPPAVETVADLLAEARVLLPRVPLLLGCMRPGGEYRERLDALAVRGGLNKIVNPARAAVATAEELGLNVEWGEECCAL